MNFLRTEIERTTPFFHRNQRLDASCQIGTKHVHRKSDGMRSGLIGDHGVRYHGTEFIAACRGQHGGQIKGAGCHAFADRARLRQGVDHAARAEEQWSRSRCPTGSLGLDIALGVGGLPRGRIVEIYGPESSGKTTLALHMVAEAQKGRRLRLHRRRARAGPGLRPQAGRRPENLLISQPDSGEQALEISETLVRSGAMDVVVVDSVAALTPRAEIEGEMGDRAACRPG